MERIKISDKLMQFT